MIIENLHKNLCCGAHLNFLGKAVLMSTNNIGF